MKNTIKKNFTSKAITILTTCLLLLSAVPSIAQQNNSNQKTTIVEGKKYIVHSISAKDTYYQLSRVYGISVKEIMAANNKKNLRVGDEALIPMVEIVAPKSTPEPTPKVEEPTKKEREINFPSNNVSAKILTEYKIGFNETLFSIAKRFGTTVDDIKKLNNLTSDVLQEGQTLKIPDGTVVETQEIIESSSSNLPIPEKEKEEIEFEANRYGIREKKEKGIGMWMEDLESAGKNNLALHRTAPVGTILKITNPLTKSVTFAKVVGKFTNTAESHDAIVILSKSVASNIGAFDKRFLIEITYGAPL